MSDEIFVRKITLKDKQSFMTLFEEVLLNDFSDYSQKIKDFILEGLKRDFDRAIENERQIYEGAFTDEKMVGLIQGELFYAGVGFCTWVMVSKARQHHGIGKKLLQSLEEKLKALGAHSIHLYSPQRNITYYQSRGYELIGQYKKGWFGKDDYMLAKTIQEPKEENFLR